MKKLKSVITVLFLALFTANTYALDFILEIIKGGGLGDGGQGSVGAPIDGGILTILGAAGVGYFLVRRKNKKKNQ